MGMTQGELYAQQMRIREAYIAPSASNGVTPNPVPSIANQPTQSIEAQALNNNYYGNSGTPMDNLARQALYPADPTSQYQPKSTPSGATPQSQVQGLPESANPSGVTGSPVTNTGGNPSGSTANKPVGDNSVANNLGGAAATYGGSVAGSFAGNAANQAVYGSSGGSFANIGGTLGGLAGGALGGAVAGEASLGLGTLAGVAAGSAFGSFVGSVIGGAIDAAISFFGGNKAPSPDKGKNYAPPQPPSSANLVAGTPYLIRISGAANFADGSHELLARINQDYGEGNPYIAPFSAQINVSGNNCFLDVTFANGSIRESFLISSAGTYRPIDASGLSISYLTIDGNPVPPNGNNPNTPYAPNNPVPPYVPPPNFLGGVDQNQQDKAYTPKSQQDNAAPSPALAPNNSPDKGKPLPNGANDPTPSLAPNSPKPSPNPYAPSPAPSDNSAPNTRTEGNSYNRNAPQAGTNRAPSASPDARPDNLPQTVPTPTPSPVTPNQPSTPNTPASPDLGSLALQITGLGLVIGSIATGLDYVKNLNNIINEQTSAPNQVTNAKTGACQALNTASCTTGLQNRISDDIANNPNIAKDAKLNTILANQAAQDGLLAALQASINSGFATTFSFFKNQVIDRAVNMLNLALGVHNALMLSETVGKTLGGILDAVISLTPLQFTDATTGNKTTATSALGQTASALIVNLIGVDNYAKLKEDLAISNRIIKSSTNLFNGLERILNSQSRQAQKTGVDVSNIGNALIANNVVNANSYPKMANSPEANSALPAEDVGVIQGKLGLLKQGIAGLNKITGTIRSNVNQVKRIQKDFELITSLTNSESKARKQIATQAKNEAKRKSTFKWLKIKEVKATGK